MLFDLFHELPGVRVQLPIWLGEVTKLVSHERLNETTGTAHVRSAEHTNLKGWSVTNEGEVALNDLYLFPIGADGENFDPLPSLPPLTLPEVYE